MTKGSFVHPDSHLPADFPLSKISDLLLTLGYRRGAVCDICDYAYVYGTVEGCYTLVSDDDRRLVEDLLPMSPDTAWEHAEGVAF